MIKRYNKQIFYFCIVFVFVMVFAYNILTPYLSDDIFYKTDVERANSFWDLIKQQYNEYLSNSGRIIGQFNIRLSLINDKIFFNVINSIMFVTLSLLIYVNIDGRKKYDICLLIIIVCVIWRYSVEFGQTILWICGACNYLWGSVIILGFITFYRSKLKNINADYGIGTAVLCFIFGVIAGWCNENTSGGGFLLILMFTFTACIKRHKANIKKISAYMVAAHAGMICGMLGMLMAPGIANRASVMEDNYTGLVGYLSRFYKCCMVIQEHFMELLIIFVITTIIAIVCQKKKESVMNHTIPFFLASAATAFALIIAPPPMDRAYFGAGVFLMIACLQSFTFALNEKIDWHKAVKYSLTVILVIWLFFVYLENLVNLGRIWREENERIALIQEAVEREEERVVVPQYRPAFKNRFSVAHDSDMTEDPEYWINLFYGGYYEIDTIIAIPRDEWNEIYGEQD